MAGYTIKFTNGETVNPAPIDVENAMEMREAENEAIAAIKWSKEIMYTAPAFDHLDDIAVEEAEVEKLERKED